MKQWLSKNKNGSVVIANYVLELTTNSWSLGLVQETFGFDSSGSNHQGETVITGTQLCVRTRTQFTLLIPTIVVDHSNVR